MGSVFNNYKVNDYHLDTIIYTNVIAGIGFGILSIFYGFDIPFFSVFLVTVLLFIYFLIFECFLKNLSEKLLRKAEYSEGILSILIHAIAWFTLVFSLIYVGLSMVAMNIEGKLHTEESDTPE